MSAKSLQENKNLWDSSSDGADGELDKLSFACAGFAQPAFRGAWFFAKSSCEANHGFGSQWFFLFYDWSVVKFEPAQEFARLVFVQAFYFFDGGFDGAHGKNLSQAGHWKSRRAKGLSAWVGFDESGAKAPALQDASRLCLLRLPTPPL